MIENVKFNYEDLLKNIMASIDSNVYFKDKEGRFIYASKAQIEGFNLTSLDEVVGTTDFDYFPKKSAQQSYDDEQNIIKTGQPLLGKEEKLFWANGEVAWYNVSKYPLYNHEGVLIGTWGISTNITHQKNIELQLEQLNNKLKESNSHYQLISETDNLTGLYNQSKFFEEASLMYDRFLKFSRKEDIFSIAFIDMDFFKKANDKYGHPFGDFVLKEFAGILKDSIRTCDLAFRYGGDEFMVLYTGTKKDTAKKITNRIRTTVESHIFSKKSIKFSTTISSGVASSNEKKDVESLMKLADTRLYRAKKSGKNAVM